MSEGRPSKQRRVSERLTPEPEDVEKLIQRYHEGAAGRELVEEFKIGCTSLKKILREHQARRKDRRDSLKVEA